MFNKQWVLVFGGICLGILGASSLWGLLTPNPTLANSSLLDYGMSTIVLEGNLDHQGFFRINHEYPANEEGFHILGMTLAFEAHDGNWHTINESDTVANNFWWNDNQVGGRVTNSGLFANARVRVILFLGLQ